MLKDLRARAFSIRQAADAWEDIIDKLAGDFVLDDVASAVAKNSAEIRARAELYSAEIYDAGGGPFRDFGSALLYLTGAAEDTRQAVADDARERDLSFTAALDRPTEGYFREIATALALLFKEKDEKC